MVVRVAIRVASGVYRVVRAANGGVAAQPNVARSASVAFARAAGQGGRAFATARPAPHWLLLPRLDTPWESVRASYSSAHHTAPINKIT